MQQTLQRQNLKHLSTEWTAQGSGSAFLAMTDLLLLLMIANMEPGFGMFESSY